MRETAARIDPTKTPQQILAELEKDHPPPDKLLDAFRDTLGGLREFIDAHQIVTIPSPVLPILEETPPFMRALTFASMDTPGPYETVAKEAFFNVTLPEKILAEGARRRVHGGLQPRHDPQHRDSRGVSRATTCSSCGCSASIRESASCWAPSSNAEGWAHYCEQMMLDEGYGNGDPKLRLGQLQDALLRDARYIVGIEMHTGKMTFDEGVEFFVKEGYQTHETGAGRNQARHLRPDVSLLHARQAANPEAARGLPQDEGRGILACRSFTTAF